MHQVSNAEAGVTGCGQLDTRRGWVRFTCGCIYNFREDRDRNISVSANVQQGSGNVGGKDVACAIVSAVIAGAILGAIDKDGHTSSGSCDSGWWCPADCIRCNSSQSACEKGGRYNTRRTQRIHHCVE